MYHRHQVVVIGGGAAGITFAAQMLKKRSETDIAIVEPSEAHYYQPAWTLCGGVGWNVESTRRAQQDYIPSSSTWIRDYAETFEPEANKVVLRSGNTLEYEQLVVCPGIQLDWDRIAGMRQEDLGKNGLCSIYTYEGARDTWQMISNFEHGCAIFTQPVMPIKCAGAPQKIMYLASDNFQERGISDQSEVLFFLPGAAPFGLAEFVPVLSGVIERYNIRPYYKHTLVKVLPDQRQASFKVELPEGKEEIVTMEYDLLHVVPPQSAPDFIKNSPLANEAGWVDVDQFTLQHLRYPNVFSLGDASSTPNSKTAAAIRKQAPILVQNLCDFIDQRPLSGQYNGYASCPMVTKKGRVVLAEFGYEGKLMPSFPVDPAQERYSMWLLKTKFLPFLYWNLMLRGVNL